MSDTITLTGVVATVPKHLVTTSGLAITSFRLASGQRRLDRATGAWVDGETNWYSVSTFRQLAFNVSRSLDKGQHVLVTGRLRVRNWENPERKGIAIEVEADAVGHDLFWCTSSYVKVPFGRAAQAGHPGPPESAPAEHEGTWAEDGTRENDAGAQTNGFLPDDAGEEEFRGLAAIDS